MTKFGNSFDPQFGWNQKCANPALQQLVCRKHKSSHLRKTEWDQRNGRSKFLVQGLRMVTLGARRDRIVDRVEGRSIKMLAGTVLGSE